MTVKITLSFSLKVSYMEGQIKSYQTIVPILLKLGVYYLKYTKVSFNKTQTYIWKSMARINHSLLSKVKSQYLDEKVH